MRWGTPMNNNKIIAITSACALLAMTTTSFALARPSLRHASNQDVIVQNLINSSLYPSTNPSIKVVIFDGTTQCYEKVLTPYHTVGSVVQFFGNPTVGCHHITSINVIPQVVGSYGKVYSNTLKITVPVTATNSYNLNVNIKQDVKPVWSGPKITTPGTIKDIMGQPYFKK